MAITKDGYDRIEYLREIVNEGEDAKAVLKYANKYLAKVEGEMLETIREQQDKEKLAEAISDYRAVVRFCKLLHTAASDGDRKLKTLEAELKKHQ